MQREGEQLAEVDDEFGVELLVRHEKTNTSFPQAFRKYRRANLSGKLGNKSEGIYADWLWR